ncbi:quorum-sensing autoinducer synthase [Vibrio mediterranei]|uniref:alpha-hydroxyketone-type quorum-sensing autoinducer synthase n=1 Tax=Vibrio mediterranei TaxID=689 RepID=UPI0017E584C7|nr:alpha-hydroxyketone-type quorum-sensing autoinducer synthase [Vibrio mediterranei]NUW74733.1 quorum-sensing autoinducer synthase [Vibrio mediterranei]
MHLEKITKTLPKFIEQQHDIYIAENIHSTKSKKHLVSGKRPTASDTSYQTNDYLCLNNNAYIKEKHIDAIRANTESMLMSGVYTAEAEDSSAFEKKLAKLTGFEECVVSQSGYTANLSLLQAICTKDTNVYVDFFAHASLWEGARIAGAMVHPFMHNNIRHLKRQIQKNGPGIILVDSIYSTLGTIAPLVDLVSMAYEYDCALVVDESHSLGTHGPKGAGLVAELGLTEHVDYITVSLAKTFAYRAGAILSNKKTAHCLPFVAFPAIFSSMLLPYETERLSATVDVIKSADNARRSLFSNSDYLRNQLRNLGLSIRSESQIIALETGDAENTEIVRDFLESKGVFGSIFCTPATPKGKNIIRFSVTSEHTLEDLDRVVQACKEATENKEFYFL